MNITDQFLRGIVRLAEQPVLPAARHHACRCLLDYLGATLAGSRLIGDQLSRLLNALGEGAPTASMIGMNRRSSMTHAALINGIASHAAELDDGVISGIIHPGGPVFTSLLAVAQHHESRGEDFLRGVVVGYEAAVKLAEAVQPHHKLRGWHATATCGAVGAAVGIMVMRSAESKALKNAFSAAVVSAGGSLKVLQGDSHLKPFNPGHASVSAITAMALAEAGFEGPDDPLGGPSGFLEMMAGSWNEATLTSESSAPIAVERVYFKPHAACRYCHPAIDAALELRAVPGFDGRRIRSIRVRTYQLAVAGHDHVAPESVSSAKMSIPFSVAVALLRGRAGIDEYTEETIRDVLVISLARLVEVSADDGHTAVFPAQTPARVDLTLDDGSILTAEVREPKGDPGAPLSDEEVDDKFLSLARFAGLEPDRASALRDAARQFDEHAADLYQLL
ncbi:MmgE/PrpD family protein [Haloferula sp. A504]|uniref:MmgE/PrpD family protein n=1 Tax=Haloferula sp. A504 TaxID=3373601 RepID=UPI0031C4B1CF|nr:MmgE/PrpD family protein [Verrucomicrobiaceae bacterium E54]